ncbi:unnamed protein product [Parascedosporium putredinis]|uniref:Uncharacterized protein n=1 Tax=Parascedosporium putredinis TaxID=1442378 RepID=A0A9P1HCR1_9PEZI|nr:unnamed protein product [Parascedosporium putredinis]CAI8005105.1 unnamed protein product [Parascedosporium putredinis]
MLPVTETVPVGMFLTSQAKVPGTGTGWRGYRQASANLETPSGATIQIFTDTDPTHVIGNTWSYSEIGINHPRLIYNQSEDTSQEILFEYALWQIQWLGFYQEESSVSWFNTTLDPVIEGLGGPYFFSENNTMSVNNTFFEIAESKKSATNSTGTSKTGLADDLKPEKLVARSKPPLNIAPPIGVRCTLSSVAGLATVDGTTSTFSDFERVDPEVLSGSFGAAFGYDAAFILQSVAIEDFYQTTRSSPQVQEGIPTCGTATYTRKPCYRELYLHLAWML